MNIKKPEDMEQYIEWLYTEHNLEISKRTETYYNSVTKEIKSQFDKSDFWIQLTENMREYDAEYLTEHGYDLLMPAHPHQPELLVKPYDSFLHKTHRKNVLENKNFPNEPESGWLLQENWFSEINDIIRTLIGVKYLDGVEFMITKVSSLCNELGERLEVQYEAKEEGYYAVHLYVTHNFEIPAISWDTERVDIAIEIQLTTQLQEIIHTLIRKYYEKRRKFIVKKDFKWQWDYKGEEFKPNYLGHILHYVEGMIMEVRDKQGKEIS